MCCAPASEGRVDEMPHPGEQVVAFVGGEGDDVAPGCDQIEQVAGGEVVRPFDVEPLDGSERSPDARVRGGHVLFDALVHESSELGDPVLALVADVPDPAEPAPGREHAGDFGDRLVDVDPVPCLGNQHDVDRAVRQRDLLGAPGQYPHRGKHASQLFPHLVGGLHGHHIQASSHESLGEFAGAGSEVEDRARTDREQPIDRDLGIARSARVVLVRRRAEGTGLDRVLVIADRHGHSLAPHGRAPVTRSGAFREVLRPRLTPLA